MTSRPAPTINNARFGEVRADEIRVRDIIQNRRYGHQGWFTEDALVMSTELVGDDIIVSGKYLSDWGNYQFTTSVGNGITVVGREGEDHK